MVVEPLHICICVSLCNTLLLWPPYVADADIIFLPWFLSSFFFSSPVADWMSTQRCQSPISGGRLPYLDVHYGLPYGRTYLSFSPFTYGASGADHCMQAGEAAVLLLDRQVHPCLLIFAVLAMRETLHDCKHGEFE